MKPPVDKNIHQLLTNYLNELEGYLQGDVISYYGPIVNNAEINILRIIEELVSDELKKEKLFVILTTVGGSATVVERIVNILRYHYSEVNFIVPDYAYSAGTIFCMSGDNIYMDYYSVLGPIDPQVQNKDGKLVAALGYLDKVNELLEKAKNDELTKAEFLILKDFDLAELRGYEQAKELTITLLKKWLVKYKFKNWKTHRTDTDLINTVVTDEQKRIRAEEIADKLSNNNHWRSHGRPINSECLESELKLQIEDYSTDTILQPMIRKYYDLLTDYIRNRGFEFFIQTRKFI